MKKAFLAAMSFFVVMSGGSAYGVAIDPYWMFTDSHPVFFGYFRYCDTARTGDYLCHAQLSDQIPDTGSSFDGSKYINLDYQFSQDTFYVRDEFDPDVIHYKDYRPGFAGFKTAWDNGLTGFPIPRYKYLIFAHKGPNLNHKVTVTAWYNDGTCGSPSFNELIGTFNGSDVWKVDTLLIPESIQNKPDQQRNLYPYFELVFIINNLDPADTTSGPPGCLKVDEIRLAGCNPIETSPTPQTVAEGSAATFKVTTSKADPADVFTYQWYKDGAAIAGAADSEYTIASVTPADAGVYTVAVTVSSTNLTFVSQEATLNRENSVINTRTVADPKQQDDDDQGGCGCGSGTILAFLPPLWFKTMAHRRRKKLKN